MKKPGTNAPSDNPAPSQRSLFARYDLLVTGGHFKDDDAQRKVLNALDALSTSLSQQGKGLGKLFKKNTVKPQGLYIWGNVGRGKSMLMDLFFAFAPVEKRRRVHFHAFMQEVHARMHQLRQSGADPVTTLAKQIADETDLLCFDEFQATDVADATLLYRLFESLFASGVTIVTTANRPPASFYTGGVQRERFAKFITLIEGNMQVASLSSPTDYRHMQIKALDTRYVHPLGATADAFVADAIDRLCEHPEPQQATLLVHGRKIPFTLYDQSIGRFSFHELCESALGAADYLALAKRCDTVILTGIPQLPSEKRNEAKRFVTLIDALYEHKVELLCTAEAPPDQIYSGGDGSFEFKRTVSRLAEMQSQNWGEPL